MHPLTRHIRRRVFTINLMLGQYQRCPGSLILLSQNPNLGPDPNFQAMAFLQRMEVGQYRGFFHATAAI
jgi:hypothetical protein